LLDGLLAPNGLIVIDNTLFGCGMFYEVDTPMLRDWAKQTDEFNRWVENHPDLIKVILIFHYSSLLFSFFKIC
jgi:predicted O-methyltransferase YrrM